MRNDTPEFSAAAVRLSRAFFAAIGGVFLLAALIAWMAGGQTFVGATATLAAIGVVLMAFAVWASAHLCASVASKVLAIVGIPL
jgi:hypothetical protein